MEKQTFTYTPENSEQFTKGTAIKDVHIFKSGKYRGKSWTKEMVQKMVENFKKLKELAGFEPPVRIGHRTSNPIENAKNVIGYIENMRADEDGNAYADLDITDSDGYKKIKDGTLRKRSMEFGPYETNEGKLFNEVLWGLGWVDIPQVEKLAEVNVYSKPLQEEDQMKKDEKKDKKDEDMKKTKKDEKKEKLDKEVEEKDIDSKDAKSEGEENAIDKGGEEAPKEDVKEESKEEIKEEPKNENLDKKEEMVQLDKSQYDKLLSYEKQVAELVVEKKVAQITDLSKSAKIVSDKLEDEKAFALSLTDEQFEKYIALKKSQPSFVELDKEVGEQPSKEPAEEKDSIEAEEKNAVEIAERVTKPYKK